MPPGIYIYIRWHKVPAQKKNKDSDSAKDDACYKGPRPRYRSREVVVACCGSGSVGRCMLTR